MNEAIINDRAADFLEKLVKDLYLTHIDWPTTPQSP
jgi:hypothetical protein